MPKFILHDLSYSFNKDNPFADDNNKQRLNVLRQMVNNSLAIDIDDVDKNVNYCNLKEDITQLYGNDCDNNITDTPMIDDIKDVVEQLPQLKYFNVWCSQYQRKLNIVNDEMKTTQETNDEDTKEEEQEAINIEQDNTFEGVIPIQPMKFDYSKTGGLTNYDITTDKPLTYDDIRKLTVNIARSKLKSTVEKSEQILNLEKEKRKELMNNIQKYKNINAIGVLIEDNIQEMNLGQLEHTLEYCEKLYQSQKLKEVIKRGANFGSLITSTIFPNGIKIGKTKQVNFKGTAKTIIDNIFDTQTTIGVAFQNIIDKHHWNITDEVVLMLSVGEMFISSIKIDNVEQQPTDDKQNETTTRQPMVEGHWNSEAKGPLVIEEYETDSVEQSETNDEYSSEEDD